jgi:hypothetical protein
VNVRAKGRAVNSVFLVQLRKIVATDSRGSPRVKDLGGDVSLSRVQGLGCVGGGAVEGFLGRSGQWIVHRGCTGNAESNG